MQSLELTPMARLLALAPGHLRLPVGHDRFAAVLATGVGIFALTLWTVPVRTSDHLFVTATLLALCLVAPTFEERRFDARDGDRLHRHWRDVPSAIPSIARVSRDG